MFQKLSTPNENQFAYMYQKKPEAFAISVK